MDRVKYPIALKLIVIITVILAMSLGATTAVVSWNVSQDTRITAEESNLALNTRSASVAESELSTVRANVFMLLDLVNSAGSQSVLTNQATSFFFERNQSMAAIVLRNMSTGRDDRFYVNRRFFTSNEIDSSLVSDFMALNAEYLERASKGETFVLNGSSVFNQVVLAMIYPWKEEGRNQVAVIIFSGEKLMDTFSSSSVNSSFMTNHNGDVLVHSDYSLVQAGANLSSMPLVKESWNNQDSSRQIMFKDEDGKEYFGAYSHLSLADLCVYTTVATDVVFEPVYATVHRNIYLTLAVLFLSVIFVYFFSKTISVPVKKLTEASDQIESGNYILSLESKTRDEIGLLTRRFVKMGKGLDEREKLKDTFGRFINKEIAEKAMKGELALGGETKNVTIFFSDIRSFTAISEKLEPYEVVEFLNDYMTRMVECVSNTHGVVDKFIGDAIMGVWGAPVSQGNVSLDALNCVRAALMMRHSLMEFNKGRGGDKKPIIKIGCGINTGPVVAGQIGSSSRMEYTVIGDAVNFASRTEALNKPLGTDILITENTYKLVKEHVIVEEMPSVTVKGKEKPVKIFAVVNMPRATDIPGAGPEGPKNMAEVRTLLGIPTPDFTKVNVNEDEKKFKIQGQ